jgi:uroporphyrinogen-III synthase
MKILITRPIDESILLAKKLELLGHQPIIAPLLKIEFTEDIDFQKFDRYDAIIISSRNAIKAIASANKNLKLIIVGKETTEFAKSLGFINSIYAGVNIAELKDNLSNYNYLLYLTGADISDDLGSLSVKIDRQIVYHAKRVDVPSLKFLDFIKQDQLRLCMFFSTRTAQIFLDFINEYKLQSYSSSIIALTLSAKIAHNLKDMRFNSCYIATEPTLDSLVNFIDRICK